MTDLTQLNEQQFNELVEKKMAEHTNLPTHRHAKDVARQYAKCDLLYPLDNWTLTHEKGDFKTYKLQLKDMPYPFVRGDTFYPGECTARICSFLYATDRRSVWDKRSEKIVVCDYFPDGGSLSQARQKGAMMVAPRWINLQSCEYFVDKDTLIQSTDSCEDAAFPAVSSSAVLGYTFSTWRMIQTPTGVKVTRIVYVDPRGTLPSAIFKVVLSELADSVETLKDVLKKHGPDCCLAVTQPYKMRNMHLSKVEADNNSIHIDVKTIDGTTGTIHLTVPGTFKDGFNITTKGNCSVKVVKEHECGDMILFEVTANGSDVVSFEGKAAKGGLKLNGADLN